MHDIAIIGVFMMGKVVLNAPLLHIKPVYSFCMRYKWPKSRHSDLAIFS